MSAILLSAHIIVAILAVGPITVAASMFPRYARDQSARPVANVLYGICQTYAVVGLAVPLLGIATAISMGVLTQAWVLVSIALAAVFDDRRLARHPQLGSEIRPCDVLGLV